MSICVVSASDNDKDIVLENDNAELPDELGSAESDVVGKKSKTYALKTDKKGVAKYNVKKMKLKKGNHKVVISSGNANYKVSAKSKITIK